MEIKTINTQFIALDRLESNEGQIKGVPRNPRQINDEDFERLKKSLTEHTNMLALRELVVYPLGDKFIVLGGNMRLRALRELGFNDAPCKVIPAEILTDELKAFVAIDNGSFGAWDWDALANEWDDLPLGDWGVPAWGSSEEEDEGGEKKDLSGELENYAFKIEIECVSESEQEKMFNELTERGFKCRILTL